ncbi:MAG TPA: LysR family transcriptional regulator, partial [Tahibacter sp.]|nr:LysR family transcriptional regulator [Tahibacter sp.]
MDRWHAMRVFAKVVETGGFAPAARALDLSAPAVTRAIAALEATIGTRLLVRTTRTVKLTDAGARYYDDCRRILADIDEAEAAAAGSYATPRGTLTVTASVLFGQLYVLPIVTEFLDRYRAVSAHALFVDRVTNLVDEGIDVAVRIGPLRDSGYRAIRVGAVRRVVCASPAYLERVGAPAAPADLAGHEIVASVAARGSNDWE